MDTAPNEMQIGWRLQPYGMAAQEDGTWVIFDRNYNGRDRVSFRCDIGQLHHLRFHGDADPSDSRVYFFNGTCRPCDGEEAQAAYEYRMKRLWELVDDRLPFVPRPKRDGAWDWGPRMDPSRLFEGVDLETKVASVRSPGIAFWEDLVSRGLPYLSARYNVESYERPTKFFYEQLFAAWSVRYGCVGFGLGDYSKVKGMGGSGEAPEVVPFLLKNKLLRPSGETLGSLVFLSVMLSR